jgi:hypothetical protein
MTSRPAPGPRYIDRPEISEVFADRLEHLFFDGATVRMEFTVTRTEPLNAAPGKPMPNPKQWSYTACRVVLSGRGAAEMLNKMMELHGVLLQQGMIQPRSAPPPAGAPEAPGPSGEPSAG